VCDDDDKYWKEIIIKTLDHCWPCLRTVKGVISPPPFPDAEQKSFSACRSEISAFPEFIALCFSTNPAFLDRQGGAVIRHTTIIPTHTQPII
jgi:hypothetical protein